MNIFEFADIIDKDLELNRYPNQDNRWSCQFEYGEIKEDCFLASIYGDGKTPDEAIQDYVERIKGKKLVFNAYDTKNRQEYIVPNTLE